jgi:hypothetical protein
MTRNRELEALGAAYVARKGFLPDRVKRSGNAQTRKSKVALGDGIGTFSRLEMADKVNKLEHYAIHLKDLGLEQFKYEGMLYDHEAVSSIKQEILKAVSGAFWARLEVGKHGRRLHVHVLAFNAPSVFNVKGKDKSLEEHAFYFSKSQVPDDLLSAGVFLESKKQSLLKGNKRLPKTSFSRGIPRG